MIVLRKKLKALTVTVGAIAALAAVAASPATAAQVATKFNASSIKLTGSGLTVKKNGAEAKTCEINSPPVGYTVESEGMASAYNDSLFLQTNLICTGSTVFSLPTLVMVGRYDTITGAYSLRFETTAETVSKSPWGSYYAGYYGSIVGAWTNGSVGIPSTIKFNELIVGGLTANVSNKISLTGTITATTSTGGLLTMSH